MKKISLFLVLSTFLNISCDSAISANSKITNVLKNVNDNQSNPKMVLRGGWIVESEKSYYEKNNKIVGVVDFEKVKPEDAYIYTFKSDTLVSVSNLQKEFSWDFKIKKNVNVLTLLNINADAEDDELIYKFEKDKLTLLRKVEDQDPEDEDETIIVCLLMTLRKI